MPDTLHTVATGAAFGLGCALIVFGVVLSALSLGDATQAFFYGPLFLAGSGLIAWQKTPSAAPGGQRDGVVVVQPHG